MTCHQSSPFFQRQYLLSIGQAFLVSAIAAVGILSPDHVEAADEDKHAAQTRFRKAVPWSPTKFVPAGEVVAFEEHPLFVYLAGRLSATQEPTTVDEPEKLDAAYFHLYLGSPSEWDADSPELGEMFPTPREAADYIMETFPIVKRKDIKRTQIKNESNEVTTEGTYITKDTSLEIYDEMATAIETGQPYETCLDPPPGPPTDAEGNFIPVAEWNIVNWPNHIHPGRS